MLVTVVLDEVCAGVFLVLLYTPANFVQCTELDDCERLVNLNTILLLDSPRILVHHGAVRWGWWAGTGHTQGRAQRPLGSGHVLKEVPGFVCHTDNVGTHINDRPMLYKNNLPYHV